MKFLKEHNTTAEYIDDFMRGDWYNTPECYATPSISYISEDLSLHCFNPREKKNVPTNQFWYKSKGNHVIIPYNTDCFIGDNNTILQIISHKYDPRVGLNVIELSGELKIIGENAFYRKDEGFKEIYMPDSVIEIQWLAFRQIGYGNIYIQFSENLKTIGGKSIVGIGLGDVWLPDSLEYIGELSFSYTGIQRLRLPNNPNLVFADQVFIDHWNLRHVVIPEGITTTGRAMFAQTKIGGNLKSVVVPSTVLSIKRSMFLYCEDLNLTLCNGIQEFEEYAFGWSLIKLVNIPDSVKRIGDYGFVYAAVENIYLPDSIVSVGLYCFWQCNNLKHITFSNNMTEVGYAVLGDLPSLKSIDFGTGINTLVSFSLYLVKALESLYIPKNITNIEICALSGCDSLTTITVDPENPVYDCRDNCNAIIRTADNTLIAGCKTTVIPSSVTSLAESAFDTCTTLETVTIPANITNIGPYCFYCCTGIRTFNYNGTTELWNSITLGEGWTEESSITQIICTNGIINL